MEDDNENASLLLKYESNNNYIISLGHITNSYGSWKLTVHPEQQEGESVWFYSPQKVYSLLK